MGCASSSAAAPAAAPLPVAYAIAPVAHLPVAAVGTLLCHCGNSAPSNCESVPRKCGLCCTGPCVRHGIASYVPVGIPMASGSIAPTAGGISPSSSSRRLTSMRTMDALEKELADTTVRLRQPCKYGLKCFRRNDQHLSKFSHPDDDDYVRAIRKYDVKAEFSTLRQCFLFCDPYQKGIIDDKALLDELLTKHLQLPISVDEAWKQLDDDGNGFTSFPEFVEWAANLGDRWPGGPLPVGIDEATATGVECGFMGCYCKSFRPRGENAKFCACGHKRTLHAVSDDQSSMATVPCYWEGSPATSPSSKDAGLRFIPCGEDVVGEVQKIVNSSVKKAWTRDRGKEADGSQKRVPSGYTVRSVRRAENPKIWRKYVLKKMLIKEDLANEGGDVPAFRQVKVKTNIGDIPFMGEDALDPTCNEWFLWHGTSLAGARNICETDFKQRLAGSTTGTLYGPGTYFAESCTKADEYAKAEDGENGDLYTMLLVRVVGGRVRYTADADPDAADLTEAVLHGDYDSVLGDREKCRNTFKEFVIFGSDQDCTAPYLGEDPESYLTIPGEYACQF